MQDPVSSSTKAFFLLALRLRGKACEKLFAFFSGDQAQGLKKLYSRVDFARETQVRQVAGRELKRVGRVRPQGYLKDVHNDWLVETLKQESPQVISLILRYLPADRVQSILKILPDDILRRLPTLGKTFDVPRALVEMIRERFESYFAYPRALDASATRAYESLIFLSAANLSRLFFELGYQEIAWGLVGLPDKTRDMIVGRLLPEDRLRVEYYTEKTAGQGLSQRVRRAQVHLISKEVDQKQPRFFVKELGFLIYAKSVLPRDQVDFEILKKKLSLHEAMALQRLVEKNFDKNNDASVLAYREDVIATMQAVLSS